MTPSASRRARLVEAAKALFHRRGYEAVSLYDIAAGADMKQGHVYYYFKSKQDIAAAVLDHWRASAQALFLKIGAAKDPRHRMVKFLDHAVEVAGIYTKWGCPIAGLSASMAGIPPKTGKAALEPVYLIHLAFLQAAFRELGHKRRRARMEAYTLLCGLQGAIHLAHVMHDRDILLDFIQDRKDWVRRLSA